jgi:pyruvate-formate lyase-activating enzyme
MVGSSGKDLSIPDEDELVPMPEYSKLFYIPGCPPVGLNPATGDLETVPEVEFAGKSIPCQAVAAFLEPGLVRIRLPAVDYGPKTRVLPMWAYTAVGFRDGKYWASAFQIESNPKWDPRNYDDREVSRAIASYQPMDERGRLLEHLVQCATENHCFAAKNLFLGRWEAPLPVSRGCNARCLGCLSLQPDSSCPASHERIGFTPSQEEIVALAVDHLNRAPEPIVSFGQGCEGEPLTEHRLVANSISEIRRRTHRGTINLNTNGSWPERVRILAESGLDSIRISLNSARRDFYHAYYRPRGYDFEDVVESIGLCREMGLYTMINYLVFPGVTDQEEELEALGTLIRRTGLNFIHLKNLCVDPEVYVGSMPSSMSPVLGIQRMAVKLQENFPDVKLGYFNQPVR